MATLTPKTIEAKAHDLTMLLLQIKLQNKNNIDAEDLAENYKEYYDKIFETLVN